LNQEDQKMPFDGHIVIGLASLFGCLCMLFFCTAQLVAMLEAVRPAPAMQPDWEWQPAFAPAS
jgi:hypothetical protein